MPWWKYIRQPVSVRRHTELPVRGCAHLGVQEAQLGVDGGLDGLAVLVVLAVLAVLAVFVGHG
ncbi:hypothetical protein ABIA31_001562 [Catenulispora sp. MAP5-51]|uniref:hypothetical protein n=1 Tax=Catenulispora sp. MAP5-51 TaxID=3156298 RepID=UPI003517BDF1